jgi:hypothetical protein|tara:strand:+ start:137 stop:481 length:345 start_codon:yes stop_codon:yes gene_type:complete
MFTRKTLKSGSNRGQRRLWIEGDFLTVNGLRRGDKLVRTLVNGALVLTPVSADTPKAKGEKRHSVAGTSERPIIDLSGAWVSGFMGTASHVDITAHHGTITISRAVVAMSAAAE